MGSFGIANTTTPHGVFNPVPNYLFSATVNLGRPLTPIPLLDGSLRIVEPIVGGTISGPGFVASIDGGVAAPIIVNTTQGVQVQFAYIYAYGHAEDGSPFYMEESGVGSRATQTTRLSIDVGGKYESLRRMYIIGQPSVNEERTIGYVECFSVPLPVTPSAIKE